MFSPNFDYTDMYQVQDDGLEGFDFDAFGTPDFTPLAALEAPPPPSPVAVQSPTPQPRAASPQPQSQPQGRRASTISVRRRSGDSPNEAVLSVTLEDLNGRRSSLDFAMDANYADIFQNLSPATLNYLNQQLYILPEVQPSAAFPPTHAHIPPYVPAADPGFQFTVVPDLGYIQQDRFPLQAPMASTVARYPPRVPAIVENRRRRSPRNAGSNHRQIVTTRPPPVPKFGAVGGRPALPNHIEPYINPGQLPQNHGRVPDKRGNKDTTVANDFYYSIGALPDTELPRTGITVAYNGVEFEPSLRFTGMEFIEYTHCALQRPDRHPILRIQIQPAQYNHRYKRAGESFKCRFASCPVKKGTILKGQARVCISEFHDENGDWLNPFHNAGYVHLDCLEKQVNFIELYCSQTVTIKTETRSLQHEPPATTSLRTNNPMALNDVERTVVAAWFQDTSERWGDFEARHPDPKSRPPFILDQEDTLTYALTKAHGDNKVLKRVQERRKNEAGGRVTAHLNEFVGDLSKQVALHDKMKKQPPKRKMSDRGDSVILVETRPKRRRVTPPVHPVLSPAFEAHVPVPIESPSQVAPYMAPPQASYNPVGASFVSFPAFEDNGLSFAPTAPVSFNALAQVNIDDPQFFEPTSTRQSPSSRPRGTPRHAQGRPSPIKVILSPPRRRSSTPVMGNAGVGRRRSSARLSAGRSLNLPSASSLKAVATWLEEITEASPAVASADDLGSLFGSEPRVEEIE